MAEVTTQGAVGRANGLVLLEEIDLSDEVILNHLVRMVSEVSGGADGVRTSVLSAEQWHGAIEQIIPPRMRRGLVHHFHVLRDPRDPGHLMISPSAIRGLNARSPKITSEVVYALIHATDPPLPPLLHRGSADIVARLVSERIGLGFFTSNYPSEAQLVTRLLTVLRSEWGYAESDWVAQLKSRPDDVLRALRKTSLMPLWLQEARRDPKLAAELAESARKREVPIAHLIDPQATMREDWVVALCVAYEQWEAQRRQARGTGGDDGL